MTNIVYLNGNYLPIDQAHISVLDRGFLFGDGVYEVAPVYSHKPFRLEQHLLRLQQSLDAIQLSNPLTLSVWQEIVVRLVASHTESDQGIYLHVTRGVAPRDHAFPRPSVSATVFAMSMPLITASADTIKQGVRCISAEDIRWFRCDIKATSLLPNVLLRQQSVEAHCAETILFREQQFLTEGTASNVFVVKNNTLIAPPKSHLMLPGITYDVVLEIAAQLHIPTEIRPVSRVEVFQADELLLTSSTKEVMPVIALDQQMIGTGKPGSVFNKLYNGYQDFKQNKMRV